MPLLHSDEDVRRYAGRYGILSALQRAVRTPFQCLTESNEARRLCVTSLYSALLNSPENQTLFRNDGGLEWCLSKLSTRRRPTSSSRSSRRRRRDAAKAAPQVAKQDGPSSVVTEWFQREGAGGANEDLGIALLVLAAALHGEKF